MTKILRLGSSLPQPSAKRRRGVFRDKRGIVAVMYALMVVPLIMVVALAVDYSFYINAQAQLNLAADAAAMHAVRVASQYYADNPGTSVATAESQGTTAGQQWFYAELGNIGTATVPGSGLTVNVTYLASPGGFSATVGYSGTVSAHLGAFMKKSWNIANTVNTTAVNNFLEVVMMLDNSSSMQVAATEADMQLMMAITPCASNNAVYTGYTGGGAFTINYGYYQCGYGSWTYTGSTACPTTVPKPPWTVTQLTPASSLTQSGGPSCKGLLPKQSDGTYPLASGPCAFACHQDGSKPAGQGNDLYALARSTIGTANPITLRFDLLKQATNQLLTTMSSANSTSNNLSVGIYTFNTNMTQIYPTPGNGEAGTDFTSAIAAVGAPPTTANGVDTGIQPDAFVASGSHADTDWPDSMDTLASTVTTAGNGASAGSPLKVLFIVTDGLADYNNQNTIAAFDTSKCTAFKNMGYTVYVVYTPYYQEMSYWYAIQAAQYVEGTGSGSVVYNLQQCASSPSDFAEANDGPSLTAALQNLLRMAMNTPARVVN